jgi:hypothetical protein
MEKEERHLVSNTLCLTVLTEILHKDFYGVSCIESLWADQILYWRSFALLLLVSRFRVFISWFLSYKRKAHLWRQSMVFANGGSDYSSGAASEWRSMGDPRFDSHKSLHYQWKYIAIPKTAIKMINFGQHLHIKLTCDFCSLRFVQPPAGHVLSV